VAVALFAVVACASNSNIAVTSSGATSMTTHVSVEFCGRVETAMRMFGKTIANDVPSRLATFAGYARRWRGIAEVAPEEARADAEKVAAASEALVSGIAARHPTTLDEFHTANDEVIAEMQQQFGDADEAGDAVWVVAKRICGLTDAEAAAIFSS
jgi:hypothetical protein